MQTSCNADIQMLDSLTMKNRVLQAQFAQQRVDAAAVTIELASLHDPHMREQLALCTQGCQGRSKINGEYQTLCDQLLQEIRSNFHQDYEKNLQQSSQSIPVDSPSNPPGKQS